MVLRLTNEVDAGSAANGQWRGVSTREDYSRWGKPVTPPIVMPKVS